MRLKKRGLSINAISQKLNCDWETVKSRVLEHENPELVG